MIDSGGYLSKDRPYLNKGQRERRARFIRIDYMPSKDAVAIIETKRGRYYPLNINSGILNAILTEWADLTGIKYREVEAPMTSARPPELMHRSARANDFGPSHCGAKTRAGTPCRAKRLPGKPRCKWHGGCSTGPRTQEGKSKAAQNLRRGPLRGEAAQTS